MSAFTVCFSFSFQLTENIQGTLALLDNYREVIKMFLPSLVGDVQVTHQSSVTATALYGLSVTTLWSRLRALASDS